MFKRKEKSSQQFFTRYIKRIILFYVIYILVYFSFCAVAERKAMQRRLAFEAAGAGIYLESMMENLSETIYALRSDPAIRRVMYPPPASGPYDYVLALDALERQVSQIGMMESCTLYARPSGVVIASGIGKCDVSHFYDAQFLHGLDPFATFSITARHSKGGLAFPLPADYITLSLRFSTMLRDNAGYICINLPKGRLEEGLSHYMKDARHLQVTGPDGPLFSAGVGGALAFTAVHQLDTYGLSVSAGADMRGFWHTLLPPFFRGSVFFLAFSVLSGLLLAVPISGCDRTLGGIASQLATRYKQEGVPPCLGLSDIRFYFGKLVEDSGQHAGQIRQMSRMARDKLVLDLLTGADPGPEGAREACQLLQVRFPFDWFLTAHIRFYSGAEAADARDAVAAAHAVREELEKGTEQLCAYSTADGSGNMGAILNCGLPPGPLLQEEIRAIALRLAGRLGGAFPSLSLFASFDGPVGSARALSESYAKACRRAEWRLVLKSQPYCLPDSLPGLDISGILPCATSRMVIAAAQARAYGPVYAAAADLLKEARGIGLLRLQFCAMAVLILLHTPAAALGQIEEACSASLKKLSTLDNATGLNAVFCSFLGDVSCSEPVSADEGPGNRYIRGAIEFIQGAYGKGLSVSDIAGHLGLNEKYLSRLFKDSTGKTIMQYISELRMKKAVRLLDGTGLTVREIGEMVGFGDSRGFIRHFKSVYGLTPGDYRARLHAGAVADAGD